MGVNVCARVGGVYLGVVVCVCMCVDACECVHMGVDMCVDAVWPGYDLEATSRLPFPPRAAAWVLGAALPPVCPLTSSLTLVHWKASGSHSRPRQEGESFRADTHTLLSVMPEPQSPAFFPSALGLGKEEQIDSWPSHLFQQKVELGHVGGKEVATPSHGTGGPGSDPRLAGVPTKETGPAPQLRSWGSQQRPGLVAGWPGDAGCTRRFCLDGALEGTGLQVTVAGESSESEVCSPMGQGLFAWLSSTGSGTSMGSSPPHTAARKPRVQWPQAVPAAHQAPSFHTPAPATRPRHSGIACRLRTGTGPWTASPSWDGDREDGTLSQHGDPWRDEGSRQNACTLPSSKVAKTRSQRPGPMPG